MPVAFQDLYAEPFSHCYGCGRNNPHGHRLKSYWDDRYPDGECTVARFTPGAQYSGGVPEHVYGGLIASLLDCHGTASASAFLARSYGDKATLPRCVTASLKVDFLRPTPLGVELTITATQRAVDGRKVRVDLALHATGQLCARGEMLAVVIEDSAPPAPAEAEPTDR